MSYKSMSYPKRSGARLSYAARRVDPDEKASNRSAHAKPSAVWRFWAKVRKRKGRGCWTWAGSTNGNYGVFGIGGRAGGLIRAHRFAWVLKHGFDPGALQVLHKCDNRLCVRWSHLFLGTQMDNVHDAIKKDRHPRGSRNGQAKLSEVKVRRIRKLYPEFTMKKLGVMFQVAHMQISRVIRRRTWKHVS